MQQRSEETRTRILHAAQRLFAQNGFDASGVAEICAAAGVSKGAFYHHFPSKQAIFMLLLEDWLAGLEPAFSGISASGGNVADSLVDLSNLTGEIFASGRGQLSLFLEFWVQASRDPAVWEATIAPYHRFQALFAEIVKQGMAQGSLREMDAGVASRVLMGLAMGLILQGLFDPQGADWEDVARQGMRFLVDGMSRS